MLPGAKRAEVPLNWVLSERTTAFIHGATCEEITTRNKGELERMQGLLAQGRSEMTAGSRTVCKPRP